MYNTLPNWSKLRSSCKTAAEAGCALCAAPHTSRKMHAPASRTYQRPLPGRQIPMAVFINAGVLLGNSEGDRILRLFPLQFNQSAAFDVGILFNR